jgi:hypothetical protein
MRLGWPRSLAPLALLVLAGAAACRDHRPPVDERLMLCLEEARAWQHRADTHLADGAIAEAIADIEELLKIHFPAGAPEGEEARLDAHARLARLYIADDEARALDELERGRKEATFDSFYRAHLETVAGEIFEARAKRLPDAEAARAARREALAAYARSIEINKRVQARLAKEPP